MPPFIGELQGAAVFGAYVSVEYPPLMLWTKIYSRSLLERVMPLARDKKIFRFDDNFLGSLIILHARSYISCEDYIYRYTLCENWPLEKYAGRVHDLLVLRETIEPILNAPPIVPQDAEKYQLFIENRLAMNMGNLCIKVEELLYNGEQPQAVLARIAPFLNDKQLFKASLFSAGYNEKRILGIWRRIKYEF